MQLLRSRWLVVDAERVESDGAVLVDDDGRIAAVEAGGAARRLAASAPSSAEHFELDRALGPGLVDAHAHLDLSALVGRVPADGGFVPWIGALLRERSSAPREDLVRAAREAATALLRSGVTAVGDIDTLGVSEEALADVPLRGLLFREALDGDDPSRAQAACLEAAGAIERPTGSPRLQRGLSPHAPHTVSDELLTRLRELAAGRANGARAQIHWAETPDEVEYLSESGGPFARILGGAELRESGLARLRRTGWLEPGTSLVHGNHPEPQDADELARAGVALVHCPGTHAFFGRPRFPWADYRDKGVVLALGTDSLASNDQLDMRMEMARLRRAQPDLSPAEVFAAATTGAARALGLDAGQIAVGLPADLAHVDVDPGGGQGDVLEVWTSAIPDVTHVWCGGSLAVGRNSD